MESLFLALAFLLYAAMGAVIGAVNRLYSKERKRRSEAEQAQEARREQEEMRWW